MTNKKDTWTRLEVDSLIRQAKREEAKEIKRLIKKNVKSLEIIEFLLKEQRKEFNKIIELF